MRMKDRIGIQTTKHGRFKQKEALITTNLSEKVLLLIVVYRGGDS
jgi:hypothetical protein